MRLPGNAVAQHHQAKNQSRFRTIFDIASVGIVRISSEGRAVESNPAAQEMLGYSAEELCGLSFRDVIHRDHHEEQDGLHRQLVAGERRSYELEKRYIRKDGAEIWAHATTTLLPRAAGEEPSALVTMQDITERKLAEITVREHGERLALIIETQRDIAGAGLDLQGVMELIVDRSVALTRAEGAMVSLVEGDELLVGAANGIAASAVGSRRPLETSIAYHAIQARDTILIERTEDDARLDAAFRARIGDRSHICVPLLQGDTAVAALNVMSTSEDERLNEQDRQTLELLAVVLASAVSRAAEFEAKREQVEALARFEATYQGALTGMLLVSVEGRIVDANPAMRELLGFDDEELKDRLVSKFVHPEDRAEIATAYAEMIASGRTSHRFDHRFCRKDGGVRWVNASLSVVTDSDGEPTFTIGTIQDVTQRRAAEEALRAQAKLNEHQALHDGLTGLANRALFRDRIEHALKAARRAGKQVAVLMMDLDRFKEINDSLGHSAGDTLLVELSHRIEAGLRESDTVARLGGDEFGLLLPNPIGPDGVIGVVERARAAIEQPVTVEGLPLSVEASIGIALYPDDGEDVDTLLRRADVAMYNAKASDAGYAFYEESRDQRDPARLTLVGELRRGLEESELVLFYQPKASLADGAVSSVEALLRWEHPERGLLAPDQFIPLAQQTGLIKPLALYVIDAALRQCREWQDEGLTLGVAVNLSARNLLDVHFPTEVQALLDRWSVDPALITLEITESTMLIDPVRTGQNLARLAATGMGISIDDFGTGFSSLARLKRLPVDEIKIDRSFIMNMDNDEDDATIVRSMIDLGRHLGLEVVAEGVETKQVWDQLAALGCQVAQGYYLSRPVPPNQLRSWLDARELGTPALPVA
jgi:diguanylate cyclase (GGDEF)-like protein/PAS domain S-box-containing protein